MKSTELRSGPRRTGRCSVVAQSTGPRNSVRRDKQNGVVMKKLGIVSTETEVTLIQGPSANNGLLGESSGANEYSDDGVSYVSSSTDGYFSGNKNGYSIALLSNPSGSAISKNGNGTSVSSNGNTASAYTNGASRNGNGTTTYSNSGKSSSVSTSFGNGNGGSSYSNGSGYSKGNGSTAYSNGNGSAAYSNGNGSTTYRSGNGRATFSNTNGNGSSLSTAVANQTNTNGAASRNGAPLNGASSIGSGAATRVTLPTTQLKTYMPAVRSAAATLSEELRSQALPVSSSAAAPTGRSTLGTRQFAWAQDSYSPTRRSVDTWVFFVRFRSSLWLLDQKWSYPGGFTEEKKKERTRGLAQYLLESLLQLGPTFIKVGQLSSTRSDLFPEEFIAELTKLQDQVPAFPAGKAIEIIEGDLGQPISRLYRSFDPQPIAAASLGQVHRAVLHTGEEVVVKVQRPGLKQLFDIDLTNLRILAQQLDRTSEDDNSDFLGIYEECATVLYKEVDYIGEGRSADRFRRNFRDTPWVRAPEVYWEYCSPRVLTLEYLPGVKISDKQALLARSLDVDLVARRATEAYLIQILRHGFFHADPHPGNLSVDAQGRLLFYDFGMMGEIVPGVREKLLQLFYGTYRKDTTQVLSALVDLGIIRAKGDQLSLRRAINYFLANLARQTEEKDAVSAIGEDLFAVALDQPFRFPATFTFVLRAFSTLEGIGKTLNPDFKFVEVATPYAQELLTADQPPEAALLQQVQQQVTEVGQAAAAMPLRIQRIDSTLEQLEGGDLKLRVRVLESERSARRQGVMQVATLQSVAAMGLLNLGTTLALAADGRGSAAAAACFLLSGAFGLAVLGGMQRVKRLDKVEKQIRT